MYFITFVSEIEWMADLIVQLKLINLVNLRNVLNLYFVEQPSQYYSSLK